MQALLTSPTIQHVPAKKKVAEEFHGQTVDKYAMAADSVKKDGALMAQNVDWRDSNSKPIDTPAQISSHNLDSQGRKYQNLQSSVFGGGYVANEPL